MAVLAPFVYADMCCAPISTNNATIQSRCRTQSNFNRSLPTRECRSLPTLPALHSRTMITGQINARPSHPTRCLSCLIWERYVYNLCSLGNLDKPHNCIVNVCTWMDGVLQFHITPHGSYLTQIQYLYQTSFSLIIYAGIFANTTHILITLSHKGP